MVSQRLVRTNYDRFRAGEARCRTCPLFCGQGDRGEGGREPVHSIKTAESNEPLSSRDAMLVFEHRVAFALSIVDRRPFACRGSLHPSSVHTASRPGSHTVETVRMGLCGPG
jgi:hypothetical protein